MQQSLASSALWCVWLTACVLTLVDVCSGQRIASITSLDTTLTSDTNRTSAAEQQRTTILDVFVRPGSVGSTRFNFDIRTFSATGANGANVCDAPSRDGLCEVSTPMSVTIEASELVHRYALRPRASIPYLYYHRKFLSCDNFDVQNLRETLGDPNEVSKCYKTAKPLALKMECKCRETKGGSDRVEFTGDDGDFDFQTFAVYALPLNKLGESGRDLFQNVILPDYDTNSSWFFNADYVSPTDPSAVYVPPEPTGDMDGSVLYVLGHRWKQHGGKDNAGKWISYYLARRLAPMCTVYDIDPIPELVAHINITMTPTSAVGTAQTLTLSTINEASTGFVTSGTSVSRTGAAGAFTARIENTQSATSAYGHSLRGSIVMCNDKTPQFAGDASYRPFINTGMQDRRLNLIENPWAVAFPPVEGSGRRTSAAGRVFDAETIATLTGAVVGEGSVGERTGIYYYDHIESLALGTRCDRIGVDNTVYSGVPIAISNVVKPSTVSSVPIEVLRGNFSRPSVLPTCIPGFGPSAVKDVSLPGRMLAAQREYRDRYRADPDHVTAPPHVPPVFNARDPNVYFWDQYMYRSVEETDVEVEVIITVNGEFLRVDSIQSSASVDRDTTFCTIVTGSSNQTDYGELSVNVCNAAERIQVADTAVNASSLDTTSIDQHVAVDTTYSAQFAVSVDCPPQSGLVVCSTTASQDSTLKFTRTLDPGICQRMAFHLCLTAEDIGSNSYCDVSVLSTSAINSPSDIFLDSVRVPCTQVNNYEPPTSLFADTSNDVLQTFALPPQIDPDASNDAIIRILIGALFFGIPLIMFFYMCGTCIYYQFSVVPELKKYA